MTQPPDLDELFGPSRNFSLGTDERVKGLGGLPAQLRRLGCIEQLFERARVVAAPFRKRPLLSSVALLRG